MIAETLNTEDLFKLRRSIEAELKNRRYRMSFIYAFSVNGSASSGTSGYHCPDNPITLQQWLHKNMAKLPRELRHNEGAYRFYKMLGPRSLPHRAEHAELCHPDDVLGPHYYVISKIDIIAVLEERMRLHRQRRPREA